MIFAQDVSHYTRALLVRLVARIAKLAHSVQYPAMHGLQPVPRIRKRPSNDDAHGIVHVGLLHLVLDEPAPHVRLSRVFSHATIPAKCHPSSTLHINVL